MTTAIPQIQVAVLGAGVIGLAVARALAQSGREVLVLERAASIGTETSSRNSQVIHAGLYYPKHSAKAKLCVQGRHMLYDYCRERSVQVKQCGKLIVATSQIQLRDKLVPLYRRAMQNGVTDMQLMTDLQQIHALEPHVNAFAALWSPSTGIVDAHHFMYSLLADAEEHGATVVYKSPVEDARIVNGAIELQVGGGEWISCKMLVNAAGLWADQLAAQMHQNHIWQPPKQYYCKGNYFRWQGQASPFSRLVYPLPDERGGLGVHATIDLAGHVKFGPNVEWLHEDAQPDDIDYRVDCSEQTVQLFYDSIRNYWPDIQDGVLVPDYAGVRPKLDHPSLITNHTSMKEQDFLIVGPAEHGVPGLVHLFGMESPGLTSAMAIAEYVERLIR